MEKKNFIMEIMFWLLVCLELDYPYLIYFFNYSGNLLNKIIFIIYCIAPCLAMNILLHFTYGNLFAKPFHIGGKNSLIIGIVFFVLYIIILACLSCVSCANDRNNKLIFNQLYHSSHEFEELRTLRI